MDYGIIIAYSIIGAGLGALVALIIGIFNPDVLLTQKVKELATEEQKKLAIKNARKMCIGFVAISALLGVWLILPKKGLIGVILVVISLILFFVIVLPASKENKRIQKELTE